MNNKLLEWAISTNKGKPSVLLEYSGIKNKYFITIYPVGYSLNANVVFFDISEFASDEEFIDLLEVMDKSLQPQNNKVRK